MNLVNTRLNLGDLIAALYEEFSKLTSNKKLQRKLVYLALMDMQKDVRNRHSFLLIRGCR